MLGLVGTFGTCRGSWGDRRTLLQQMLILATPGNGADAATAFFALTQPRTADPQVVTGQALAAPAQLAHVCPAWRSLPHACAVVAYSAVATSPSVKGLPPFTWPGHRFFTIYCGEQPVPLDRCPRLGTGAGDPAADIHGFVTGSMERGSELADVLDRTSGPVTVAVLHHATQTVVVAHRGQTLWLSRPRGESCWFLTTGRHVVAEASRRVYGPAHPYSDISVAIADESLMTIHLDHGTPVISGRPLRPT